MKQPYAFLLLLLAACNNNKVTEKANEEKIRDTISNASIPPVTKRTDTINTDTIPVLKQYANKRFKEVTVEAVGENKFRVKGKGQIFESRFGWIIEDGHNELAHGFADTQTGAPEWGEFDFTVEAKKVHPNTTLHLVLFENSANDGSRQYQLAIPLY